MTKTFCDRCGKEVSSGYYHVYFQVDEITDAKTYIRNPLKDACKDLCPMCYGALQNLMEGNYNGK